jgi:hypothetical protein
MKKEGWRWKELHHPQIAVLLFDNDAIDFGILKPSCVRGKTIPTLGIRLAATIGGCLGCHAHAYMRRVVTGGRRRRFWGLEVCNFATHLAGCASQVPTCAMQRTLKTAIWLRAYAK